MTKKAKIYQPAKTAMQSGKARTHSWLLEFKTSTPMRPDSLMGWNTMTDTLAELSLTFKTCEEAVAYATAKGIPFEVVQPKESRTPPKQYAANFSFNRRRAYSQNN
jgi:hypothetical protein